MRADPNGQISLLEEHLRRLARSASLLGFEYPGDASVRALLAQTLTGEQAPTQNRRVRLLLSPTGSLSVTVAPLPDLAQPQRLAVSAIILPSDNPWLRHKTTHRPWYQAATAWLESHPGVFDLVYCNERGEVCEGSRSNVFAQIEGRWVTPPLTSGLLAGVQRQRLMASEPIEEAVLRLDDLQRAQTLRLSNALRGWFDVELDLTLRGG